MKNNLIVDSSAIFACYNTSVLKSGISRYQFFWNVHTDTPTTTKKWTRPRARRYQKTTGQSRFFYMYKYRRNKQCENEISTQARIWTQQQSQFANSITTQLNRTHIQNTRSAILVTTTYPVTLHGLPGSGWGTFTRSRMKNTDYRDFCCTTYSENRKTEKSQTDHSAAHLETASTGSG